MVKLECDRCGKDCGLNALVVTVNVIHNPSPVRFEDVGDVRLTDDHTHIRFMLCEKCYTWLGFPNPYRSGDKLKTEIENCGKESG